MADIQDTVLFDEARVIIREGVKPIAFRWEAVIHANGKDISTMYVENRDLDRNYVVNRFDILHITVAMGPGDYNFDVYPYKDNVEVTLRKIPLNQTSNTEKREDPIEAQRYRAILMTSGSALLENNTPVAADKTMSNNASIQSVQMQLVEPIVEKLRMVTVGGVYRKSIAANLIRAMLGYYSKKVSKDATLGVKGVDVAANYINAEVESFIIPHSTPLINFPAVIDEICGGVYNGGLGYYLQDQLWYLFPPYDITRYEKSTKSLTIVNLTKDRFPEPEQSYRTTKNQVIILSTAEVKHIDASQQALLNQGNGVRFVDASMVLEDFTTVENNKALVNRAKNISEFIFEKPKTGLNQIQESESRITTNYAMEYAKLAYRNGSFLQVTWENCNEKLLYPGMPVKVLYLENAKAKELYGVLVGVQSTAMAMTPGGAPKRHVNKAALTVFVSRKITVTATR